MNKDIQKYKINICSFARSKKFEKYKLSYGYTSTVYKVGEDVIKEIYLPINDVTKTSRYNELLSNVFLEENPDYGIYSVPFLGYEVCDKKLYLKFKYSGRSLGDSMLDYSVPNLKKIYKKTLNIIDILNKKLIHGDLNVYNIYIDDRDLEVTIGDWGKASFEINKEASNDKDFFKENFRIRILSAYYFEQHSLQAITQTLKDLGLYKDFTDYYDSAKKETMQKFSFRPKQFIKDMFTYYYHWYLINFILNTLGENFFLENTKFSKSMLKFIETLTV